LDLWVEVCTTTGGGFTAAFLVLLSSYRDRLRVNPEENAMLLSESTHNSREVREKMVELMFEKFSCPALFLAKSAVLNSFAVAKQTSLVVDAGYTNTTGKEQAHTRQGRSFYGHVLGVSSMAVFCHVYLVVLISIV
jgi:hypothetical protein